MRALDTPTHVHPSLHMQPKFLRFWHFDQAAELIIMTIRSGLQITEHRTQHWVCDTRCKCWQSRQGNEETTCGLQAGRLSLLSLQRQSTIDSFAAATRSATIKVPLVAPDTYGKKEHDSCPVTALKQHSWAQPNTPDCTARLQVT